MMREELLAKADTALGSAKVLLGIGDTTGACNRAYYAAFDASRAALLGVGIERISKTHSGLIAQFGNEIVAPGLIAPEMGRALNRMHRIRLVADYTDDVVPVDVTTELIALAENFVRAVKEISPAPVLTSRPGPSFDP